MITKISAEHKSPIGDFKPRGAFAGAEILDELRAVSALLTEKAIAEEAEGFRAFIVEASQRSAVAAKEGGFLGFHAERVSEGEADMLVKVGQAIGQG